MIRVKRISRMLRLLRLSESKKPIEKQCHIPTMRELARIIEFNPDHLSRLHKTKTTNLTALGKILDELNNRGFNVGLSDIFEYIPPTPQTPPSSSPPQSDPIAELEEEMRNTSPETLRNIRERDPALVAVLERVLNPSKSLD